MSTQCPRFTTLIGASRSSASNSDTRSDEEPSVPTPSEGIIDKESSEPSIFDSRSPQSSATTTIPLRAEEWDRTLRHIGLRDFGVELNNAAKAVFPNNKKSRYSRVYVLLLSWKTQDPKLPVQKEIANLHDILDGVYHYDVEEFQIPDRASHVEVSKKINTFVEVGDNSCNDLKIVYYAGHGRVLRNKELVWFTIAENKNQQPSDVVWSAIQRSLELANSDVLILLDCCSSGVANESVGVGITELICACPYDTSANGVGYYSFTQALVTELQSLSSKPCFSVGELYIRIYTRMQSHLPQGVKNERYPPPVHFVLTDDQHFERGIKLSIQEPERPNVDAAEKRCLKRVRFQEPSDLEEPKGSSSCLGSNKRVCLGQDSNSRIESIVKPWIENSGTSLDPQAQVTLPDQYDEKDHSQEPHANGSRIDQESGICSQKVLACTKDTPRALFVVRFQEDISREDLSVDLFQEWLRSAPAAIKEVRVEAAFKCFSTLVLISVPLSMNAYILQHPAVIPLGAIKSSIFLPAKTRNKPCKATTKTDNKNVSIVDFTKQGNQGDAVGFFGQELQLAGDKEYESGLKIPETPGILPDLTTTSHQMEIDGINFRMDSHKTSPETPEFEVSGPAMIYVRNIMDKFPKADLELVQRLGEANWQRHVRIRSGNQISKVGLEVAGAKSVFHDSSTFYDSGLGSSIPVGLTYAPSVSSFVSKVNDDDSEYFRVPPTPAEALEGKPFKCFICGHLLTKIKNRVDWKMHVFADIKPYICIISSCKDALCTFASRSEFVEHQKHCHPMTSPDILPSHGYLSHMNPWRKDVSDPTTALSEGSYDCPLCQKSIGSSKRAYISHLAKHMESIALATLPPAPEDVSGEESDSSNQSVESVEDVLEPPDFGTGSEKPLSRQEKWDLENPSPRQHPLYHNVTPHADGLYHCPWEKSSENCQHKPEKLKCNYDKFLDSHLKPYKCKVPDCSKLGFSSTAVLLRHEREAHAMHEYGDQHLCNYEDCERSAPGNGFSHSREVLAHINRVHFPSIVYEYMGKTGVNSALIETAPETIPTAPVAMQQQAQQPSLLESYHKQNRQTLWSDWIWSDELGCHFAYRQMEDGGIETRMEPPPEQQVEFEVQEEAGRPSGGFGNQMISQPKSGASSSGSSATSPSQSYTAHAGPSIKLETSSTPRARNKRRASGTGPAAPTMSGPSSAAAAVGGGEESTPPTMGPPAKKSRTNTPWTPAEEQRLKTMRDAGNSWADIAKTFPSRTEGSVKKHWYKDMHYAEL